MEAQHNNRSLRELKRQFDSGLYVRCLPGKKAAGRRSKKSSKVTKPQDIIKDPYVLEFLGLKEDSSYSESELEQAIINKLEHFLLELGR